jgi:hypothetical protein
LRCRSAIRSRSGAQVGVAADIIGFRAQKATFGAAQTNSCRETVGAPAGLRAFSPGFQLTQSVVPSMFVTSRLTFGRFGVTG